MLDELARGFAIWGVSVCDLGMLHFLVDILRLPLTPRGVFGGGFFGGREPREFSMAPTAAEVAIRGALARTHGIYKNNVVKVVDPLARGLFRWQGGLTG